jgi:glycosyltransferase involved in cell wall biosynthesis
MLLSWCCGVAALPMQVLHRHGVTGARTAKQGVDTAVFSYVAAKQPLPFPSRLLPSGASTGTAGTAGTTGADDGQENKEQGKKQEQGREQEQDQEQEKDKDTDKAKDKGMDKDKDKGTDKELFVVFSGGKLEYRKGQDLVIRALAQFMRARPEGGAEVLLVTAWYNAWGGDIGRALGSAPQRAVRAEAGAEAEFLYDEWLEQFGIDRARTHHLGMSSKSEIAAVLAASDVALFPNRAEGGTNLVAMEAMSVGLPVVLSNNTGHADIVRAEHCYPLPQTHPAGEGGERDWGESEVADIVAALERVQAEPREARAKGKRAAQFIREHYTWKVALDGILQSIHGAGL